MNLKSSDITHRNMNNCDNEVVQDIYPQINQHWSLQAYLSCSFGITISLRTPLAMCLSEIAASEMSFKYLI